MDTHLQGKRQPDTHHPDRWLLVEHEGEHRVLGSWGGGYLGSDSWRLNSGVVGVKCAGDDFVFEGRSGSEYVCRKTGYGSHTLGARVLAELPGSAMRELDAIMWAAEQAERWRM